MDTAFVKCNFLLDSVVRDISTTDRSEVNDFKEVFHARL